MGNETNAAGCGLPWHRHRRSAGPITQDPQGRTSHDIRINIVVGEAGNASSLLWQKHGVLTFVRTQSRPGHLRRRGHIMPPKRGRPQPPPPPAAVSLSLSSDSSALSLEPLVLLPPDGGYGWVVVAACFAMNLIIDGAIYTFGYYQKNIQEDFAKDSAAVALLASLCSGFYYVAGAQARARSRLSMEQLQ
ncbi:hypothetical protein FOCC_FOCC003321 [Frankliniella occidentalis]|nr:hypothetical protein FOCC_FOCC003321 [Frankliniella occidentalis]